MSPHSAQSVLEGLTISARPLEVVDVVHLQEVAMVVALQAQESETPTRVVALAAQESVTPTRVVDLVAQESVTPIRVEVLPVALMMRTPMEEQEAVISMPKDLGVLVSLKERLVLTQVVTLKPAHQEMDLRW